MSVPDRVDVLHVDDEPAFLEVASQYLERLDDRFTVVSRTNAGAALDVLEERPVDCVVSDYEMPGKDGLEFLEAVRAVYPELPFVLFTGKGSEAVASDAISAGVTDYLQKSTGIEQFELLANRITNAVEAYHSGRMLAERTRRLETLISNLPGMVYRCRNKRGWPMETVEGEVEELIGYTAEQLETGEVVWGEEILHPDDRPSLWETVQERLAEDGAFELTYRVRTREDDVRWVWERGRGVYEDGDLAALEGFITDVTDRTPVSEHEG